MDLQALFTAIAGVLVVFVMQGLKAASPFIANLPDIAKSLVVLVIAGGVSTLQSVTGFALLTDVSAWDAAAWQTVLTWGLSMGWHAIGKKAAT